MAGRTSPARPPILFVKEFAMCTTRLGADQLAGAEIVGQHPEPEVVEEPKTKVVKRTSKGVKTK